VRTLRAVVRRGLLAAGLWWALTGGSLGAPVLAALVVASAGAISLALVPPLGRVRPVGIVRFAAFFARESVRGGVDVARRALAPGRADVDPAFVEVVLRLEAPAPRLLLVGCTSLLPGTLSADLDGRRLVVHVLDPAMRWEATLAALQERVADLYGVELAPAASDG
jgi:multicomponent Na+:H+ antiporter subunit E